MSAVNDFNLALREGRGPNRLPFSPFHIEKEWNALAGDDLNFPFHMASAEGVFRGKAGIYTVCLKTLTERDGECAYNVYVNDKAVGLCQKNPPTNEFCTPALLHWTGVEIPANAKIRVESNSYSNLKRPEFNFFEYARGRWTGIYFKPEQDKITPSFEKEDLGMFEKCLNIGSVDIKARTNYHKSALAYYLISGGTGVKDINDSFGYLYKSVSGDFILEANVKIIGLTENNMSSAGLIMRQSSVANSAFICCLVQKDGIVKMRYRSVAGESIKEVIFKVTYADMIEIEKKGTSCIVSAAKLGDVYEKNSVEITGFNESLMIGFLVYSSSKTEKEAACFNNVRFYN